MKKKRFFSSHAKSSAMLVSLAVHGILIAIAVTFVAVSVMPREEPAFEPKKVNRPKMPPKKLKVPVDTKKKKPKPRLRKRMVVDRKMADIQMPEISGVAGGLGNMGGDGLGSLGFDLEMDLFGSDQSMGNELTGTFYDLKQTRKGKPTRMTIGKFFNELSNFSKGWNVGRLDDYYKAPKQKYTTFFMIPMLNSTRATKAFGVEDVVKPNFWCAYYVGHIAAPESGYYRLHGYGDDVLLVRVKRRLVLDAGFEPYRPKLGTKWESDDDNNRKFPIGRKRDLLYIGDWFRLNKGQAVKMEVLIGDVGGECSSHLLIEQRGVEYKTAPYSYTKKDKVVVKGKRPVLPIFKTREIPKELHKDMQIKATEVDLQGPSFGAAGE